MIPGVIPRPSSATRPMRRDWPAGLPLLGTSHGVGSGDPASTSRVDRFLNRRLRIGLTFLDEYRWTAFRAPTAGRLAEYHGLRDDLIVSVPMVMRPTGDGGTLAEVVAGSFDAHFTAAATAIAALFPTAILRIGWEFNGNWYPWSAHGDPATWIAAFRRIVGLFRAVSPTFKVMWSPNKSYGDYGQYVGMGYTNPGDCWPGGDVVDFVGLTCYDDWRRDVNAPNIPGSTDVYPTVTPDPTMNAANRWTRECLGAPYGVDYAGVSLLDPTDAFPFCLAWAKGFAGAHSKGLVIAECGAGLDLERAGRNIGDDGYFVSQIIAWAIGAGVFAMNYYDKDSEWSVSKGVYTYRCVWSRDQTVTGFAQPDPLYVKPAVAAAILAAFGA